MSSPQSSLGGMSSSPTCFGSSPITNTYPFNWALMPSFIKPPPTDCSAACITFILSNGALELPSLPLQRALIEAYAEYAHPYLPTTDLHSLLNVIDDPNTELGEPMSLLLYQAILLAGSAFIDTKALQVVPDGFASKRILRQEMSRRVMSLYDSGYENDTVILTQATLIMSSYSDMAADPRDSWYWVGRAIALASDANFHKASTLEGRPKNECMLLRRIWWSCYIRDRFLALGLRRKMRINDACITISPLDIDDFDIKALSETNSMMQSKHTILRDKNNQLQLAEICVQRVYLCHIIGTILTLQESYKELENISAFFHAECAEKLERNFAQIETALDTWKILLPRSCEYLEPGAAEMCHPTVHVHRSHLHMAFYTAVYSLHQPRFLPSSPTQLKSVSKISRDRSGTEVLSIALQITRIASELSEKRLVSFLPVTGVTILVPAMAINLLGLKSKDSAERDEAFMRFSTCMKVMTRLQETYHAADSTVDYFNAALRNASISLSALDLNSTTPASNVQTLPASTNSISEPDWDTESICDDNTDEVVSFEHSDDSQDFQDTIAELWRNSEMIGA